MQTYLIWICKAKGHIRVRTYLMYWTTKEMWIEEENTVWKVQSQRWVCAKFFIHQICKIVNRRCKHENSWCHYSAHKIINIYLLIIYLSTYLYVSIIFPISGISWNRIFIFYSAWTELFKQWVHLCVKPHVLCIFRKY